MINHGEKIVLIDPYFDHNQYPSGFELSRVDTILLTHGHFDHVGSSPELAIKHNSKVFCTHEVGNYLKLQGVPADNVTYMNIGGTINDTDVGLKYTMTMASHTSSCGSEPMIEGGGAAGFLVHLPNGHTIYHCGDTDAFGDMKIISDIYQPDIALLCVGGHFTMGPKSAAYCVDQLLHSLKIVVPMHYQTWPVLTGTPAAFQSHLKRKNIIVCNMTPGEPLALTGRDGDNHFDEY